MYFIILLFEKYSGQNIVGMQICMIKLLLMKQEIGDYKVLMQGSSDFLGRGGSIDVSESDCQYFSFWVVWRFDVCYILLINE